MSSISSLELLSDAQKRSLAKGGVHTVDDILLTPAQDIMKSCKMTPSEVSLIVDLVCRSGIQSLSSVSCDRENDDIFTTGDENLDRVLGGGIRTSMLWEIAGESAAGKTQFALQLSLMIQLPVDLGGLDGAACYLTTKSDLQTSRLKEILSTHPVPSASSCSLDDIHTMMVPSVDYLLHVLSETLPTLITRLSAESRKPVRLIVIDAVTELFHSADKTSSTTLKKRSRNLTELACSLHRIAARYSIAVFVLNEVIDAFEHGAPPSGDGDGLLYQEQRLFFSCADSVVGDRTKEAGLGLAWANQINTRIFFSRTNRRRYVEDRELSRSAKRPRMDSSDGDTSDRCPSDPGSDPLLIRRMTVLFSSIASEVSLDYIVTQSGVTTLAGETAVPLQPDRATEAWQGIPKHDAILASSSIEDLNDEDLKELEAIVGSDEWQCFEEDALSPSEEAQSEVVIES